MLTNVETFNPIIPVSPLVVTQGESPFQIKDIKGLDPVPATINTTKYGSIDGEFFAGSTTGKRNIVITIGLFPDGVGLPLATLRQMLYTYFMPKSQVRLRFHSTHLPVVDISGYVESFEPDLFSKEIEYQISIICPSSDFVDIEPTVVQGVTIGTGASAPVLIEYTGTVDTGFLVTVSSNAGHPTHDGEVIIDLTTPREDGLFLVDTVIDDENELHIKTLVGNKYVRSYFPGTLSFENILGRRADGSKWLQFVYGDNYFQVKSETPGQDWKLTYYNRFGGI